MGANSEISWTHHTFNPWEGCTKVSPGCAHCYAETRNARFGGGTALNWGKGAPRRRTSVHNWNEPRRWNRDVAERAASISGPLGAAAAIAAIRPRVFCASIADWLDDEVPIEWLADLLALIHETPHLDWLLLTKRPENWLGRIEGVLAFAMFSKPHHAMLPWLGRWHPAHDSAGGVKGSPIPPDNIWIGTTVEDQQRADERIPVLLSIPARVRFLSCEPLLGPVDLRRSRLPDADGIAAGDAGVHWVIAGGESGPGARPMHPDWARSLRDQCATAGVAFHHKQWGEWLPQYQKMAEERTVNVLATHHWPDGASAHRVGKKAAGRLLDGFEHNAFPEVAS